MKGIYFNLCRTFLIFKVWPVLCANICTYATSEKFYQQTHVTQSDALANGLFKLTCMHTVYMQIVPIRLETFQSINICIRLKTCRNQGFVLGGYRSGSFCQQSFSLRQLVSPSFCTKVICRVTFNFSQTQLWILMFLLNLFYEQNAATIYEN